MRAIRGAPTVDPFARDAATKFNGRHVARDTELTVRGVRGRCRFLQVTTNPRNGARWVDVVDARGALRSFALDRVTHVHRTTKTRGNT